MLTIIALAISILSLIISFYLFVKIGKIAKGDEVKRSWSRLSNPNSYESKQLKNNMQLHRRR